MKLHRYIDHDWQMTPIDFLVTNTPRIMKLHRYIDNDWQLTPIDFQVTRSKDKVTGIQCNLLTALLDIRSFSAARVVFVGSGTTYMYPGYS
ncbi:hypothetical protein DPMN_060084 [Dreissena polymorpha]|uniref:Uncharacterized protein n=1 Tax=Dreissena polymorpha TaxID=45954 RepID=A0A9D4C549_DREPO|nr:hypothetical protein DPMN_060084 [Dreissena polymorpha]